MPNPPALSAIIQRFRADTITVDGGGRVTAWPDISGAGNNAVPYAEGPLLIASDPTFARFPSVDFRRVNPGDPTLMLKADAASLTVGQGTYGIVWSLDGLSFDGDKISTPMAQELLAGDPSGNCSGPVGWIADNRDAPTLWEMEFGESFFYFGSPRGGDEFFGGTLLSFPFASGLHDSLIVTPSTPDTTQWYLDGGSERLPTHSYGPPSQVLDCLTIGGRHGSLSEGVNDKTYWQGRVAELVVWSRPLATDEIAAWETYVQDRYVHGQPDVPVSFDVRARDFSGSAIRAFDQSEPVIRARDFSGSAITAHDAS